MTDASQLSRASDAEAILAHPLIAEALEHYEQEIRSKWTSSSPRDAADREKLYQMHCAATHFRNYLLEVVTTGKLIRAEMLRKTPMQRLARAVRR